jgi:hypothetical protein
MSTRGEGNSGTSNTRVGGHGGASTSGIIKDEELDDVDYEWFWRGPRGWPRRLIYLKFSWTSFKFVIYNVIWMNLKFCFYSHFLYWGRDWEESLPYTSTCVGAPTKYRYGAAKWHMGNVIRDALRRSTQRCSHGTDLGQLIIMCDDDWEKCRDMLDSMVINAETCTTGSWLGLAVVSQPARVWLPAGTNFRVSHRSFPLNKIFCLSRTRATTVEFQSAWCI